MCPLVSPQLQAQKLRLAHSRGPFYSGSLPNVNQIGTGVPEFQVIHSRIGGAGGVWGGERGAEGLRGVGLGTDGDKGMFPNPFTRSQFCDSRGSWS